MTPPLPEGVGVYWEQLTTDGEPGPIRYQCQQCAGAGKRRGKYKTVRGVLRHLTKVHSGKVTR